MLTDLYADVLPSGAIARMGTVRLQQKDQVLCVSFSAEGDIVRCVSADKTVCLYDVKTGKRLRASRRPGRVEGAALAPGGGTLAFVEDDTLYLWHLAQDKKPIRLTRHETERFVHSFSPDGKLLASATLDGDIHVWEVPTGKMVRHFGGKFASAALSPREDVLATGDGYGRVQFWDVRTGKMLRKIKAYGKHPMGFETDSLPGSVHALAFDAGGKMLATACGQKYPIRLWEVSTGKQIGELADSESGDIMRIALSPDSKTLVAGYGNNTVGLWDVPTGKRLGELGWPDPFSSTYAVAFSPDGKWLASGGADGRVRLWELSTLKPFQRPPVHELRVDSLAFSPDGTLLATAGEDQTTRVWDVATSKQLLKLPGPAWGRSDQAKRLAFVSGGKILAFACADDSARFWEVSAGKEVYRLLAKFPHTVDVAFAPDGKIVAQAGTNGRVRLADVATGKKLREFGSPAENAAVKLNVPQPFPPGMLFFPDGKILALTAGGEIQLRDVATGKELRTLLPEEGTITAVAFSANGTLLALGLASIAEIADLQPGESPVKDAVIRIWDVASGQEVFRLGGLKGMVRYVAFSPDGRILAWRRDEGWIPALNGEGQIIHLLELTSGKEMLRLRDEGNMVHHFAFSPNGKTLASAMEDGTALIWDLAPPGWENPAGKTLGTKETDELWNDLASIDAAKAYRAVWTLSALPDQATFFLKNHLQAVVKQSPKHVSQLIADLNSDSFRVREGAVKKLAELGREAEPELRRALAKTTSAEVRRRVEILLKPFEGLVVKDPDTLRTVRAIWVLERIGTKDARTILKTLADGAPEARPTHEAQAALARLSKKPSPR